jgi:hypothetical protein
MTVSSPSRETVVPTAQEIQLAQMSSRALAACVQATDAQTMAARVQAPSVTP